MICCFVKSPIWVWKQCSSCHCFCWYSRSCLRSLAAAKTVYQKKSTPYLHKKKSWKKLMHPFPDSPKTLAWAVLFISTDTRCKQLVQQGWNLHPVSLWEWWTISRRGEAQAQWAEKWEKLAKEKTQGNVRQWKHRGWWLMIANCVGHM